MISLPRILHQGSHLSPFPGNQEGSILGGLSGQFVSVIGAQDSAERGRAHGRQRGRGIASAIRAEASLAAGYPLRKAALWVSSSP
jgi:hypothetical protein